MAMSPAQKAQLIRQLDANAFPMIGQIVESAREYDYQFDHERFDVFCEWVETHLSFKFLQILKESEPKDWESPEHREWQKNYDTWKLRFTGYAKIRASGQLFKPEMTNLMFATLAMIEESASRVKGFFRVVRVNDEGETVA
jgi:hypothetical protein